MTLYTAQIPIYLIQVLLENQMNYNLFDIW